MKRGRKKDSPALAEAKRIFGVLGDEYHEILMENKKVLKAFFGRKGASIAEQGLREQVESSTDVTFTKSGGLTMDKEVRKSADTIKAVNASLEAWSRDVVLSDMPSDMWSSDVKVKEALVSAAKAAPPATAKAFLNRRIDQLRKFFGDDSVYIKELHKDLEAAGVRVTAKHRIADGSISQLWDALKVTPRLQDEIASVVGDFYNEKLSYKDKKSEVKKVMKSSVLSSQVAQYYSMMKASSDDYAEALQEFYYTKPGDETTAVYADYLDVLNSLMHPGRRLSDSELQANLAMMLDYMRERVSI